VADARRWVRRGAYAAAALLAAGLALDVYARYPSSVVPEPIAVAPATRTLVVLVHGSGGREEPGIVALERRFRELAARRGDVQVVRYIWSPWSDNTFRAGANGARIGRVLGTQLAAARQLTSIHLVGHSAGAYLLDPLCEGWRAARGADAPRIPVAITFLDPIGFRDIWDKGWGSRQFGRCADYAEAFINTDDPAPATDRPLAQAWNVDVTAAGHAARFDGGGHRWPVRYYLEQLGASDIEAFAANEPAHARGAVELR
jgi:hypothetical protein